jgi:dynein heavy chain
VTLQADSILASAIVTYGGAFPYSHRRDLIDIWVDKCKLECIENFQIQELFGDHFQIKEWHSNGL